MKTVLFVTSGCLCAFDIGAQNLVLNPGFETLRTGSKTAAWSVC